MKNSLKSEDYRNEDDRIQLHLLRCQLQPSAYITFVMVQDMLYSFSLVILVLFLIGMFRKHEEKIDWIFQGFTVVPIFWIFCCIYYMFNREKKLKQIEFVNYTEKFTKLRKVVFFVSSLMSLASSVLLLIQYFQTSGKTWTKDDITRLICFISLGVFVAILYVCLLVQNEKMRDASVLTSRFWIKSYITMQDTRENRSVRSAFDLAQKAQV